MSCGVMFCRVVCSSSGPTGGAVGEAPRGCWNGTCCCGCDVLSHVLEDRLGVGLRRFDRRVDLLRRVAGDVSTDLGKQELLLLVDPLTSGRSPTRPTGVPARTPHGPAHAAFSRESKRCFHSWSRRSSSSLVLNSASSRSRRALLSFVRQTLPFGGFRFTLLLKFCKLLLHRLRSRDRACPSLLAVRAAMSSAVKPALRLLLWLLRRLLRWRVPRSGRCQSAAILGCAGSTPVRNPSAV